MTEKEKEKDGRETAETEQTSGTQSTAEEQEKSPETEEKQEEEASETEKTEEEKDEGPSPVPYTRFKEVNEERKQLRDMVDRLMRRLEATENKPQQKEPEEDGPKFGTDQEWDEAANDIRKARDLIRREARRIAREEREIATKEYREQVTKQRALRTEMFEGLKTAQEIYGGGKYGEILDLKTGREFTDSPIYKRAYEIIMTDEKIKAKPIRAGVIEAFGRAHRELSSGKTPEGEEDGGKISDVNRAIGTKHRAKAAGSGDRTLPVKRDGQFYRNLTDAEYDKLPREEKDEYDKQEVLNRGKWK